MKVLNFWEKCPKRDREDQGDGYCSGEGFVVQAFPAGTAACFFLSWAPMSTSYDTALQVDF